jgi:hypothetical protein
LILIGDAMPLRKILSRWVTPSFKAAGFTKRARL